MPREFVLEKLTPDPSGRSIETLAPGIGSPVVASVIVPVIRPPSASVKLTFEVVAPTVTLIGAPVETGQFKQVLDGYVTFVSHPVS